MVVAVHCTGAGRTPALRELETHVGIVLEPARTCVAVTVANVVSDRISRTQWSGVIKPDHCRGYPSETSSNRTPSRCAVERMWRCPDTTTAALKRRCQS